MQGSINIKKKKYNQVYNIKILKIKVKDIFKVVEEIRLIFFKGVIISLKIDF